MKVKEDPEEEKQQERRNTTRKKKNVQQADFAALTLQSLNNSISKLFAAQLVNQQRFIWLAVYYTDTETDGIHLVFPGYLPWTDYDY